MKKTFKYLAGITVTLVAVNFVSVGMLVAGLLLGIQSGMWMLWFLALLSTCATLIAASAASIVFIVEFSFHGVRHVASAVQQNGRGSHKPIRKAFGA